MVSSHPHIPPPLLPNNVPGNLPGNLPSNLAGIDSLYWPNSSQSGVSSAMGLPPPTVGMGIPPMMPGAVPNQQPSRDDIIANAIVVKNIPFAVAREQILQLIDELHLPRPYAFNYHYDDRHQFRGLAFGNFRAPEEAEAVVAALHGFEISGRRLKVEFKRVLHPEEKMRIETNKAIRRMQSLQVDRERHTPRAPAPPVPGVPPGATLPGARTPSLRTPSPNNPHMGPYQSASTNSLRASAAAGAVGPTAHHSPDLRGASPSRPTSASSTHSIDVKPLDFNEPGTLELYSRLLLFKDDRARTEMAFSARLSPTDRATVHQLSDRLGIHHLTIREPETYVLVSHRPIPQATAPRQHLLHESHRVVSGPTPGIAGSRLRPQASLGRMAPAPTSVDASLLTPGYASPGNRLLRTKKSAPAMTYGSQGPREYGYEDPYLPTVPSLPAGFGYGQQGLDHSQSTSNLASLNASLGSLSLGEPSSNLQPNRGFNELHSDLLSGLGNPHHAGAIGERSPRPTASFDVLRDSYPGNLGGLSLPSDAGLNALSAGPSSPALASPRPLDLAPWSIPPPIGTKNDSPQSVHQPPALESSGAYGTSNMSSSSTSGNSGTATDALQDRDTQSPRSRLLRQPRAPSKPHAPSLPHPRVHT